MARVRTRKIMFIVGTLGLGGAERQLYYMLKILTQEGLECRVFCLTKGDTYESKIIEMGIPVIWIGRSQNRVRRLVSIILEAAKWSPDIIQASHSFTSIYAVVAGLLLGKTSIVAVRSNGYREFANLGLFGKITLGLARTIVGNSKAGIQSIRNRYSNKQYFLLNNAIDCGVFQPLPNRIQNKSIVILTVGRLVEAKRHDIFIRTVALAKKQCNNIKGIIVGDGVLADELKILAQQLGLSDELEFAGGTENILDYYQHADIFVLSSDYEGTPNVVMEAMACGLPVIATRVGGTIDLIEHGVSGYLVEDNNPSGIVHHVVELAASKNLRTVLGANGTQRIKELYDIDVLKRDLLRLYDDIT